MYRHVQTYKYALTTSSTQDCFCGFTSHKPLTNLTFGFWLTRYTYFMAGGHFRYIVSPFLVFLKVVLAMRVLLGTFSLSLVLYPKLYVFKTFWEWQSKSKRAENNQLDLTELWLVLWWATSLAGAPIFILAKWWTALYLSCKDFEYSTFQRPGRCSNLRLRIIIILKLVLTFSWSFLIIINLRTIATHRS